nr:photosystem I P700 chlorophyll a apoprotein A1, chloroplastic [Tanacetum cinerariifolium]
MVIERIGPVAYKLELPDIQSLFVCVVRKEEDSMIIRSPEPELFTRAIMISKSNTNTSYKMDAREAGDMDSRSTRSAYFGMDEIVV